MPKPDDLIRHLRFAKAIKGGKVFARAFKPDPDGISVTLCGDVIEDDTQLETYIDVVSVDAPVERLGVCFVKTHQVEEIGLAVTPDPHDEHEYGDLHHLIQDLEGSEGLAPNEDHREQLALAATQNGGFRATLE